MVDVVGSASEEPLRITIRPNCAVHPSDAVRAALLAAPVGALIAAMFARFGAWPIALFLFLAILGLGIAAIAIRRHRGDSERIAMDAWRVTVDRHDLRGDQHYELNGPWVQLIEETDCNGGCSYLALRSRGEEISLGQFLTEEERGEIGRLLRERLRRFH